MAIPGKASRNPSGPGTGFKGNKSALPSKPCVACGRPMSWRKRWAANWAEVKFCSDACRRGRSAAGGPAAGAGRG
jgi:hypothetical protein